MLGQLNPAPHAAPDVSLRRKWLNAVQTRSLDSQTPSDRVCTNSGSHGTGERNRERRVGGREGREKKTVEERQSEKDWEREWKRMGWDILLHVPAEYCSPFTGPALTLQDLHHQPIRERTPGPSLPLSKSNLSNIQWIPISLYNA